MTYKSLTIFTLIIITSAIILACFFKPEKKIEALPLPVFEGERILPQIGNQGNFPKGYMYPKGLM